MSTFLEVKRSLCDSKNTFLTIVIVALFPDGTVRWVSTHPTMVYVIQFGREAHSLVTKLPPGS